MSRLLRYRDNELFEIRIDELVTKWSGSLEVGVTSHNPEQLDFPETMTCMRFVVNEPVKP